MLQCTAKLTSEARRKKGGRKRTRGKDPKRPQNYSYVNRRNIKIQMCLQPLGYMKCPDNSCHLSSMIRTHYGIKCPSLLFLPFREVFLFKLFLYFYFIFLFLFLFLFLFFFLIFNFFTILRSRYQLPSDSRSLQ